MVLGSGLASSVSLFKEDFIAVYSSERQLRTEFQGNVMVQEETGSGREKGVIV